MGEVIFLLAIIGYSLYIYITSINFEVLSFDTSGGPGLFPSAVSLIIIVVSLILIINILRKRERKHFVFLELFNRTRGPYLLLLIAYVVSLRWFGFLISSIVYVNIASHLFMSLQGKPFGGALAVTRRIVIQSAAVVGIYLLFSRAFGLILPPVTIF